MRQFLALLLVVLVSAPSVAIPVPSVSSTLTPPQYAPQDPCPNC